jgi:hypothetical protein
MKKLPSNFRFLREMYMDDYYPVDLVDRLRDTIKELVSFLEAEEHTTSQVQDELDRVTKKINDLQGAFEEEGSEIETMARDSIGVTISDILKFFDIGIHPEDAIRKREW